VEIGRRVPMADAQARVTGSVEYSLGFELPRQAHAHLLRSPHAHARVLRVDTSAAEKYPGVFAVVSRDDFGPDSGMEPYFGPMIRDMAPVAIDKVRFVGDVVAGVAAVDAETAAEAAALIEVDYDPLPAVFDAQDALAPEAPVIHEGERRVIPARRDIKERSIPGTNLMHRFTLRHGDVEEGFAQADHVIDQVFEGPSVEHVPMEPHNCIAQYRGGKFTIWSSTQSPFQVAQQVAGVLRIPQTDVRVIVFTLGGGYGNKVQAKLEPITAILAKKAGRPVKLVTRREESFLVTTQHATKVRIKTGFNNDGTLVANETTCFYNCGPYADSSPNLITRSYVAAGPYRFSHVKSDSYGAYTNAVPAGPFRGYGVTQVTWPHEAQMDAIADHLGIDPIELRRKNLLVGGDTFATGEPFPEGHYLELLDWVEEKLRWKSEPLVRRDGSKVRAKGAACVVKGGTALPSTAVVKLNGDGSMNVLISAVEMGQGAQTVLAQMAADYAGLPLEKVRCSEPDTATTPFESMTVASRTTFTTGGAIRSAVDDMNKQLTEVAAGLFGVDLGAIRLDAGAVHAEDGSGRSLPYGQVIMRAGRGNVIGKGFFGPTTHLDLQTGQGTGSIQWHPGIVGCEVEVDVETGKCRILELHAAVYVGTMINPVLCELQIEGSVFMGIGQTFFEEILLDVDGQVMNGNLNDYMIPSFLDLPEKMSVLGLEVEDAEQVHGIGETAVPPTRPAIANAIFRAIGARIPALPLTPEKVLRAIGGEVEPPSYRKDLDLERLLSVANVSA
jgi:CO/xanthine dehydrogenase Mo-binding subunit